MKIVATYAWRNVLKKRQYSIDLTSDSKISFSNSSDIDSFSIDIIFRKKFKRKTTKHKINKKKINFVIKKQKKKIKKQRRLNKKIKNHDHVLMKRWLCDFVECFNRSHYCWQFQNENNRHYKLWFNHISRWNRIISQHDVTIEDLFNDLKKRLYVYVYAHQKKKTIEKTNQIANKIANASNATASNFISKFILMIEQKISFFQQFEKFIKTPTL